MKPVIKKDIKEILADYYRNLDHPLAEVVIKLKNIILQADPDISEHIKWNSPAFYYNGDMLPFDPKEYKRDLVVVNLHKKDRVLLVFPTGAKVKDDSGVLEGVFSDTRKIAQFYTIVDVVEKEKDLVSVIKKWVNQIEK